MQEFEAWHAALPAGERHLWRSKYYKGLGTSTAEEGREYFRDLDRHILSFTCGSKQEAALLDMAFSKKRVRGRSRPASRVPLLPHLLLPHSLCRRLTASGG